MVVSCHAIRTSQAEYLTAATLKLTPLTAVRDRMLFVLSARMESISIPGILSQANLGICGHARLQLEIWVGDIDLNSIDELLRSCVV